MGEKRRAERKQATGGVLYAQNSGGSDRIHTGLLMNISSTGVCIYTQEMLEKDTSLKIYFKGISHEPMDANVMWCSVENEDLYRVGLRFDN